jgi:hypothetical protein
MLFMAIGLHEQWNDGIVECWNTGYGKRITVYSLNYVESTFSMIFVRPLFSAFSLIKYAIIEKNQCKDVLFDSFFF